MDGYPDVIQNAQNT